MSDPIEELRDKLKEAFITKEADWTEKVYKSQQYQQELKYLRDISKDFVDSLRLISIYSTRAGEIYNNFLCIRTIDDLIQSSIGILSMVENGIHNTSIDYFLASSTTCFSHTTKAYPTDSLF